MGYAHRGALVALACLFLVGCGDTGSQERLAAVADLLGRNFDGSFGPDRYTVSYNSGIIRYVRTVDPAGQLHVNETHRCVFVVMYIVDSGRQSGLGNIGANDPSTK
jgi:hypothetical protein